MKTKKKFLLFITTTIVASVIFTSCHKKEKVEDTSCTPVWYNSMSFDYQNYQFVGYWVKEHTYTTNCMESEISTAPDTINIVQIAGDLFHKYDESTYVPIAFSNGYLNLDNSSAVDGYDSFDMWKFENGIMLFEDTASNYLYQYRKY